MSAIIDRMCLEDDMEKKQILRERKWFESGSKNDGRKCYPRYTNESDWFFYQKPNKVNFLKLDLQKRSIKIVKNFVRSKRKKNEKKWDRLYYFPVDKTWDI